MSLLLVVYQTIIISYPFATANATFLYLIICTVIDKLLALRGAHPGKLCDTLLESEIKMVCLRARDLMMSQPMLLELSAPLKIVGDTHGQFYDLLRIFEYGGEFIYVC